MTYNFQDIINLFLNGETSGRAGAKSAPGNLGIQGDQLLHYTTPIMERSEKGIIVNQLDFKSYDDALKYAKENNYKKIIVYENNKSIIKEVA